MLSGTPQVFHDRLGGADNIDYYHFTLAQPATVQFGLNKLTGNAQVTVSLLHDSGGGNGGYVAGTPISPYVSVDASGLSAPLALAAGPYHLQLLRPSGPGSFYDLSLAAP